MWPDNEVWCRSSCKQGWRAGLCLKAINIHWSPTQQCKHSTGRRVQNGRWKEGRTGRHEWWIYKNKECNLRCLWLEPLGVGLLMGEEVGREGSTHKRQQLCVCLSCIRLCPRITPSACLTSARDVDQTIITPTLCQVLVCGVLCVRSQVFKCEVSNLNRYKVLSAVDVLSVS